MHAVCLCGAWSGSRGTPGERWGSGRACGGSSFGDSVEFSFSLDSLFCLLSVNWPYIANPWTPGHLLSRAFVVLVADIPGFHLFPSKSESKDRTVPNFSAVPLSPDTVQVMDLEQFPKFSRVFPVPSGTCVALGNPRAVTQLQHCAACSLGMVAMGWKIITTKRQVCVSPSPRNCSRHAGFRSEEPPSPHLTTLLFSGSMRPEVLNVCI